jgi:hypothetical protein
LVLHLSVLWWDILVNLASTNHTHSCPISDGSGIGGRGGWLQKLLLLPRTRLKPLPRHNCVLNSLSIKLRLVLKTKLWESVTFGSVRVHYFLCFPFTECTVPTVYLVFNSFIVVHPFPCLKCYSFASSSCMAQLANAPQGLLFSPVSEFYSHFGRYLDRRLNHREAFAYKWQHRHWMHPCSEWDLNLWFQFSGTRRQFTPETVLLLQSEFPVLGLVAFLFLRGTI